MPVLYTLISHKGESRISVNFQFNNLLNIRIKKVDGAKWSKSLKCWHIPDTPANRKKCKLPQKNLSALVPQTPIQTNKSALVYLSKNNNEQMQKFLVQLQLKAYSPSTIRTYKNEFAQLLHLLKIIPAQNLQAEHLQRYLLFCIQHGLSENTIPSRINALKFYYEQVLHNEKMFFEIPRPKKPLLLPGVFNKEEIASILNSVNNLKQKTILMLAYACGLRVSEVVSVCISDIDSKRMIIHLHGAKGKKDRIVNISPTLIVMLREYYKLYKPKKYLFEGQYMGEH